MRTFSEEEARAVFAQAAREAPADDPVGIGERLTLDELVEIGRASGLDPERVAQAAQGLGTAGTQATPDRTLLGVPLTVRRSRTLPIELSDDAWEESVAALRTLFGGPGTAGQVGRIRDWSAPPRQSFIGNVQATASVRPLPDGRTLVEIERHGQETNTRSIALTNGIAAVGFLTALVLSLAGVLGDATVVLPLFAAMLLACSAGSSLWARREARADAERYAAALDRVDLISRLDAAPEARTSAGAPPVQTGRLDLGALDDAAGTEASPASRTRTR